VSLKVPGLFGEIEAALEQRGQAILYGPPGTGKTWQATRFAVWWLLKRRSIEAAATNVLADPKAYQAALAELTSGSSERRVWWVVANPSEWGWDRLFVDRAVDFRVGRLGRNYAVVQPDDLVVGYQSTPDKRVVALARVRQGLHDVNGEPKISLVPVAPVHNGLTYDQLQKDSVLHESEPMRFRNQGTLFALNQLEAEHLLALLAEADPELPTIDPGQGAVGPLTRITFHPAYGYEDFIEGFRPTPTSSGQLDLRLTSGIFKSICRAAAADDKRDYLLLIDEINRGNIPKILGELITLLELDKRGERVILPQSGEAFAVPRNVYVLGTMNTADRSIRLLDAALRRRFAFLELMPQPELLKGVDIDGLDLANFLTELNLRIARYENREKQVGHSFFMDHGKPIADAATFARVFRQEVLPLLQEFAYDDYGELKKYLGSLLVDSKNKELSWEDHDNPDALIDMLIAEYQPTMEASVEEPA
jgi:5-methylcytosine-specific restriction protein B